MNRILYTLLVFSLSILSGKAAVKFFGGNITYTHQGNGVYQIYLDVFLDCSGDSLSNDTLYLQRQGAFSGSIALLTRQKIWDKDITGLTDSCSSMSACKSGNFAFGFRSLRYRYEVDLSTDPACKFLIYWDQYQWSGSFTTGYANQDAIVYAELDRCTSDRSSPQFSHDPKILLMRNMDEAISFAAIDSLSDSISYALTPVPYNGLTNPGYWNYSQPLTYFGFPSVNLPLPAGFHLNANSGLVQFRPTSSNQVAVISVEVTAWKRIAGSMQIVSKVYRYQGVHVAEQDTVNHTPSITTLSANTQLCLGDTLYAKYSLHDLDSTQFLDIVPIQMPEGMTWTIDRTQANPLVTFTWIPDSADVINNYNLYSLEFKVIDDYCPLPKSKTKHTSFALAYRPDAMVSVHDSGCGFISISIQNVQNSVGMGWYMDDGVKPGPSQISITNPPRLFPSIHYSQLRLGGYTCNTSYYDTLNIKPYGIPDLSVNMDTYCPNTRITLQSGVDSSFSGVTYTWNWQGNNTQNMTGTLNIQADSGMLYLHILDSAGCEMLDTLKIRLYNFRTILTDLDTTVCTDMPYPLFFAFDSLTKYKWWDNSSQSNTFATQSGIYWLEGTDTNGCSSRDSFEIILNPIPKPNLGPDANICQSDSVLLDAGSGYVSYTWSDGQSTQSRWVDGNSVLYVFVTD